VGRAGDQGLTRKPLGLPSLLALGVNGVVGVGIFFAPREVAQAIPGWRGLSAYVAVTLLLLPTGLVFARLGAALPRDGGPYLYARAAFGPNAAFAVGWITYVSALFSTAAVVVGLVEALDETMSLGVSLHLFAELALVTVLLGALSRGLRPSALAWSAIAILKMLPLLALPCAALLVRGVNGTSLAPSGLAGAGATTSHTLLTAALPVLFALQGFEVVPLPAGEATNATKTVPLATVGSLLIAGALYVMLHASCVAALPDLDRHALPLADAAAVYGGPLLRRIIVGATSLSALGIVVGMLAMTPRYLAPLGAPDSLGFGLDAQDSRAIPRRAFAVTRALLLLVLCANAMWGSIGRLLALSSLSVTLQYGVTAASLFALASRKEAGLVPRDRWPAPLALGSSALLMFGASSLEIPILAATLCFGFIARAIGRRVHKREPGTRSS